MKEESFDFIEENVMKSKKPQRQLVAGVKRIALYGVIFGTLSGGSFALVNNLISNYFENHKEPEKIALSTTIEPEETKTPEDTPNPDKKKQLTDEKRLEKIADEYTLLGKQAKRTKRSLVEISNFEKNGIDGSSVKMEKISGTVIAKTKNNIMILTRYSEIRKMQRMNVTFMEHCHAAGKLYSYDSRMNLAIISVKVADLPETALKNLVVIEFGDSQYLEQGNFVYVIGQPDGVTQSMEFGYITRESVVQNIEDYQMDIYGTGMAYHSNGYGIVCDINGKCLGILDSKMNKDDVTVFMGIAKLKYLLENLLNKKQQCYVGITGRGISAEYLAQFNHESGLYVTEVTVDSPAYEAGIQVGDVIRSVDGEKVDSMTAFFEKLQKFSPKDAIEFSLVRETPNGKKDINVKVILKERK